ncbi:hypothetical protein [Caballeronia sp. LjRoot31]|uniref:hypothetical protein n=1 Tax=Caballeronia sp. LjRoot31 TaxID=3342324 RepID=UPI003ECFC58E
MALSSIGSDPGENVYAQAGKGQSSPAASSALDASAGGASASAQASSADVSSQSSTQVTLSPEAKSLAALSSEGVTLTQSSIAGLDLPSLSSVRDNPADLASYLRTLNSGTVAPPTNAEGKQDGEISEAAFEQVVEQFGGSKTQADQLFGALGANDSNPLTNAVLLQGLAATSTDSSSAGSQSLLTLMDQNGDGSASQTEFLTLETALVAAEKAPKSSS